VVVSPREATEGTIDEKKIEVEQDRKGVVVMCQMFLFVRDSFETGAIHSKVEEPRSKPIAQGDQDVRLCSTSSFVHGPSR